MRKSTHIFQLTLILLFPVVGLASVKYLTVWDKHWTSKYDTHFRKYTKRYFGPQFNWYWFKAQAIAESTLNPRAKSKTGAVGVMQILPSTYKFIRKRNPHFRDIKSPRWNIAAGVYYDKLMYSRWKKKDIPPSERLYFTFGSYNAGFGGILKAWKKAKKKYGHPKKWAQVEPYSPKEARIYVKKIEALMGLEKTLPARAMAPSAPFVYLSDSSPDAAMQTCLAAASPDQRLPVRLRQYSPTSSRPVPASPVVSNT